MRGGIFDGDGNAPGDGDGVGYGNVGIVIRAERDGNAGIVLKIGRASCRERV